MRRVLLIGAVVVTLVSGAGLVAASAAGPASGGVVEIPVTIHNSRFVPGAITVAAGTKVRFVVDNTDPIDHEFLVGDQSVQDRHETGTEAHHGAVPGEISVPADEVATTTYLFDRPGTVLMGCHLPGHWDYGMQGAISVT
ncbi:MAG TPA: cupredoxin domain-containing protein [Acidimicrobiales bacterium]|nr:cupredoxin domain-containing protein [Acidimicrobiales bacterium]